MPRTFHRLLASLAVCGFCLVTTPRAFAQQYLITDLGVIDSSSFAFSQGYGLNSLGQVAIQGSVSSNTHAGLYTPGGTAGPSYNPQMQDLGIIGGSGSSYAYGVNSYGQIAGQSNISGTTYQAALWTPGSANGTNGSWTNLGTLGNASRTTSKAFGINDSGEVIGYSYAAAGGSSAKEHAILWKPGSANGTAGSMFDLGTLFTSSDQSFAYAINANGQVVGYSNGGANNRAFLWTPTIANGTSGTMVDIGSLTGSSSAGVRAYALSGNGFITGDSTSSNGIQHAFLYDPNATGNKMKDLGNLGSSSTSSVGNGVNSSGKVVGQSNSKAFYYDGTTMTDLNTMIASGTGWNLINAQAINDNGQIVGWGNINGVQHSFLLTLNPVPLPPVPLVTLVGVTVFGMGMRRSRRSLSK